MAIYRGAGGASDSVDDATVNAVAAYAASAASSAIDAAASAVEADAAASSTSGSVAAVATSASNAATSASNASISASNASVSASSADASATSATASALAASVSAFESAASALGADTSEANAAASAASSSTFADNSAASAASALAIYGNTTAMNNAVSAAATSASNAATSASNAATSAITATTQAANASDSAIAADSSELSALIYANNASISASNAATSAANAATSATASATSATNSAAVYGGLSAVNTAVATTTTNANNAATSASNAATSATQAAASAASASAIVLGVASSLPSIRPTLNLDFANSDVIDPRITFTRASTATYYDGKTTAKAEENLVVQSQAYSGGLWATNSFGTITDNSATAPDGTTTAASISNGVLTGVHGLYKTVSSSIGSTLSIYAKAGTSQYIGINPTISTTCYAVFDLTGGTVTASVGCTASMVSVGNGWYRCIVANTSVAGPYFIVDPVLTSTTAPYSSYTASNQQVYIWGAQLEQRSTVTAYTPTTTQAITNYIPVLQTAASGAARLDYDPITFAAKGLLIEEARTNLLTYSSEFDNAAWIKSTSTVITNAVVSPDGLVAADKVLSASGVASGSVVQVLTKAASAIQYTTSVYAKLGEWNSFGLYLVGGGLFANRATVIANLASGTINTPASVGTFTSASATIVPVGNGWYRVTLTATSGTETTIQTHVYPSQNGAFPNGDGTSGIYIWGAQLEAGAFATSYIPTTTAQATRAADSASMTGTNFSNWYNAAEGTFAVTGDLASGTFSGNANLISVADSGLVDFMRFWIWSGAANVLRWIGTEAGATQFEITKTYTANITFKAAGCYIVDNFGFSMNGGSVGVDTSGLVITDSNKMFIGSKTGATEFMCGHISSITYYSKRISNTELQALTA